MLSHAIEATGSLQDAERDWLDSEIEKVPETLGQMKEANCYLLNI